MTLQDFHIDGEVGLIRRAKKPGEAAEHVHDCFGRDVAGCGAITVSHIGDIDELESCVLVRGNDVV